MTTEVEEVSGVEVVNISLLLERDQGVEEVVEAMFRGDDSSLEVEETRQGEEDGLAVGVVQGSLCLQQTLLSGPIQSV